MVNLNATSPQLAVVKSVVDAFSSCDITNNESSYSKDFKFQSFPKTVDHVEETKGEHFKNYGGVVSTYTRSDPVFHEIIEAPGKVVLHSTTMWVTADGTVFNYDTVLIFTFVEEDGKLKILDLKDFSDPEKRQAFHNEASKARGKTGFVA